MTATAFFGEYWLEAVSSLPPTAVKPVKKVLALVRKAGSSFFCFDFPQFVALLNSELLKNCQAFWLQPASVAASKPPAVKPRVCLQIESENFEGGRPTLF
jgi:hypothetical protein